MIDRRTRVEAPVAVRLIDVDNAMERPPDCSGYKLAMVYFRRGRTIIGRDLFRVSNGLLDVRELRSALDAIEVEDASGPTWSPGVKPVPPRVPPGVTVAVCTRNRGNLLATCLESLTALDRRPLEIIVVDNCPSDNSTRELVSRFSGIQYVRCDRPGLDRARNVAIQSARGEIIAFTDDDARVDRMWLKELIQNFADPIVAVANGITLPAELETEGQVDFELGTSFIRGFRRREFTLKNANPLLVAGMGAGVNMAIRLSMLEELGSFDERLDGGTPTRSGGDHEFFSRVLASGYRIVYDPSAIVWHQHRKTRREIVNTMHGYGVGVSAWWTKALIERREFSLILLAPAILLMYHLRNVARSLLAREGAMKLRYSLAEVLGFLTGPFAYLLSSSSQEK